MALHSRLHIAAMKPLQPSAQQIPAPRTTSMTRVIGPGESDWDTILRASQGVPGAAVDTTALRAAGPSQFSSLGWIRPTAGLLTPGSVGLYGRR